MTTLVEQRELVAETLRNATITGTDLSPKNFQVVSVPYRPVELVGDPSELNLTTGIRFTVAGVTFDEASHTRASKQREFLIRVFVEAVIEPTHSPAVDEMLNVVDQVLQHCSNMPRWTRMEVMRDEHGLPFMFHLLRQKSVFQGIIHPVYYAHARKRIP